MSDADTGDLINVSLQLPRHIIEEAILRGTAPAGGPDRTLALAKSILAARRSRAKFFKGIKLGEPSWDMILDLYVAHGEDRRVDVTGLYLASGVASTTAVRYVEMLEEGGFIHRTPDDTDGRRFFVTLADALRNMVEQWLENSLLTVGVTIPAILPE